jgi:[glutamine synthetase] adenylyltransferase / [glutamine synthetase]-adenylyl-L-tyrosine phosphorylase
MFNPFDLPRPADPKRALIGLQRWREAAQSAEPAVSEFMNLYASTAEGRTVLECILGNSPFLGEALLREPGFFCNLLQSGFDTGFGRLLDDVRKSAPPDCETPALMRNLRQGKRRAALLIALADISNSWSLAQVTGALSDFAEVALQAATGHALLQAHKGGRLTLPDPQQPEVGSGLIVLAMGKFGARELNYSSDIDLIVLFDDGVVPAPEETMTKTFVRLAKELVRLMEERTADGYVFRTDLRLRPDPGATPLAVSVSAAEGYYGSLGQNWERAAMIKARPVAGDRQAGAAFMQILKHFVWRRSLDFAAIQDIHSIKRQIGTHKGHRQAAVNGHNIKIGRGGIREIEFFTQTQQLIFGGRDTRLRVPQTVRALDALVAAGRLKRSAATILQNCYSFLRRVEHRIQMVDDQQTHELPKTDDGVSRIATFLGYDGPEPFRQELLSTLRSVEDHYAGLFEESAPLSGPGNLVFTGSEDDPETMDTLRRLGFQNPSAVAGQIRAWHHGRYRATRSTKTRELLTELTPTLLEKLGQTPAPDHAFLKFDEFLSRLPAGVQLFTLFQANPRLLELVAEIMGTAPRLSEQLARRPAILDAVLEPGFFDLLPDRPGLEESAQAALADSSEFEDLLLSVRRWTNDQRVRAGIHLLRSTTDADRCGPFLTDVAEIGIARIQAAVEVEFARRHGVFTGAGFAIIGMGRLGARSLTLRSDLDLITVYDVPEGQTLSDGAKPLSPNDYFIRLTQRLISAMTAQTAEGQLYDVDLRLRPSGNKGPLAVSAEGFARYQRENAWTWEHMALTRARIITGTTALRRQLTATMHDIICLKRDPDRLLHDVADMRRKMAVSHGTDDIWDVKHVRGGTVDIQFIAQYLILLNAHGHPDIIDSNTVGALAWLGDCGFLDLDIARDLMATVKMVRRVQGFLRLTTEGKFNAADAPMALRAGLARAVIGPGKGGSPPRIVDFVEAEAILVQALKRAHGHFQTLIETPARTLTDAIPVTSEGQSP